MYRSVVTSQLFRLLKLVTAKSIARTKFGRRLLLGRLPRSKAPSDHPFDRLNGTETSGFVPFYLLSSKYSARAMLRNDVYPYLGCNPGCVRRAIEQIPDITRFVFYDFGSGMGRAMIVASEYPFQKVVGVEISAALCATATRNAAVIASRHPERCEIRIVNVDIADFDMPNEAAVVFMYHPFGPNLMKEIVSKLERKIKAGIDILLIYENPLSYEILDSSTSFVRCFAAQVKCKPEERPYTTDDDEAVVMWRAAHMVEELTPPDTSRLCVTKPGWRVEVRS